VSQRNRACTVSLSRLLNSFVSRADFKNEKLEEKLMVFENELEKKELTFRELA